MGRPLGQRSGEKDWLWSTKAQLDLRMGTMPYRIIPISREHPLLGSMISPSSMRRKRGYEIYYVISTLSTRSIAWHKGFMALLVILISCVIFFLCYSSSEFFLMQDPCQGKLDLKPASPRCPCSIKWPYLYSVMLSPLKTTCFWYMKKG
jgi:hypothetical protein